jgi:Holliday junction resolvase RusA-like endonuclease
MKLDKTIRFVVPGTPMGRTNPFAVSNGDGSARLVQSQTTRTFEALVAMAAHAAFEGVPVISKPVVIDILALFPRPKKMLEKGWPDECISKPTKPDWDNIAKAVCDGLKGRWTDDCVIVRGACETAWSEKTGSAQTVVEIRPAPAKKMVLGHEIVVFDEPEKKTRRPKAPSTTPMPSDSTLGF